MFVRLLHLLLIAGIIGCPLVCQQGVCGCTEQEELAQSCCANCAADCDSEHHPAEPADEETPLSCELSQCLCAGAILKDHSEQGISLEWTVLQTTDIFHSTPATTVELVQYSTAINHCAGCCADAELEIYGLHMAYLC